MTRCRVPPNGWKCTREAGHCGPCAAWPTPAEQERFEQREAEAYFWGRAVLWIVCFLLICGMVIGIDALAP